jgi:hypothetical protein
MNNSNRMFQLLCCVLILFVMSGCVDERKTNLERGIGFMRSFTNSNPAKMMVAAHYRATTPDGMVTLYYVNLRSEDKMPAAYSSRQSLKPWSILVLPGNSKNSLILEGYGDDLAKPLIVEEITFKNLPDQ